MLKKKTNVFRKTIEGDGDGASGPLKRPIKDNHVNATYKVQGYNKPLVMIDYEKHESGIQNSLELEMDDPCVLRQGFVGLITGRVDFNGEGIPFILIERGTTRDDQS